MSHTLSELENSSGQCWNSLKVVFGYFVSHLWESFPYFFKNRFFLSHKWDTKYPKTTFKMFQHCPEAFSSSESVCDTRVFSSSTFSIFFRKSIFSPPQVGHEIPKNHLQTVPALPRGIFKFRECVRHASFLEFYVFHIFSKIDFFSPTSGTRNTQKPPSKCSSTAQRHFQVPRVCATREFSRVLRFPYFFKNRFFLPHKWDTKYPKTTFKLFQHCPEAFSSSESVCDTRVFSSSTFSIFFQKSIFSPPQVGHEIPKNHLQTVPALPRGIFKFRECVRHASFLEFYVFHIFSKIDFFSPTSGTRNTQKPPSNCSSTAQRHFQVPRVCATREFSRVLRFPYFFKNRFFLSHKWDTKYPKTTFKLFQHCPEAFSSSESVCDTRVFSSSTFSIFFQKSIFSPPQVGHEIPKNHLQTVPALPRGIFKFRECVRHASFLEFYEKIDF